MPIVELTSRVAYIPGGVNTGVVRGSGGRCVLIDAGLNETSGKKAIRAVQDELNGIVVAIITTHAHADHFGANSTVVQRTGARVFAPAIDEALMRYPILQAASLFAGADPPPSMRGGFLLAPSSPVDVVLGPGIAEIEGVPIEVVPLPGHSPNQVGILVDGVFFAADVVLPEAALDKYRVPYLFSVRAHLDSLTVCTDVACQAVMTGHGPMLEDLRPTRDANLALMHEVLGFVLECCSSASTAESVLAATLERFGASPKDAPGYYLLHPTIHAFLAYHSASGRLQQETRDGRSWWRAA